MTTFPARWSIWLAVLISWVARTVSGAATLALVALVFDAWQPEVSAILGEPKQRLLWLVACAGVFASEELIREWWASRDSRSGAPTHTAT